MKTPQEQAAKDLADVCRLQQGQLEELAIATEDSIGKQGAQVRVKIGSEWAKRLDRDDDAATDLGADEQRLETPQDGVVGHTRQLAEQGVIPRCEYAHSSMNLGRYEIRHRSYCTWSRYKLLRG